MRVITDPTIQGMSGRFPKSSLVMNHREGKTVTYASPHLTPKLTEDQLLFSTYAQHIMALWSSSHQNFKNDLKIYTSLYNEVFKDDLTLQLTVSNIWLMFHFRAWDQWYNKTYDLLSITNSNWANFSCGEGYSNDIVGSHWMEDHYVYVMPDVGQFPSHGMVYGDEQT